MRTAEDGLDDSGFKGLVRPRRVGQLLIQGLPIPDAASEELGPFGHHGDRIRLLGQQAPERRLVPTQLVSAAVPMPADALPQGPDFLDELLACHPAKVFVHDAASTIPIA